MRSLVKGVSWRTVGTIDTMIVAYFITGLPISAITIGGFEVFTKIGLFYLHERVWGKVWWGRISDGRDPKLAAAPAVDNTYRKDHAPVRDLEEV